MNLRQTNKANRKKHIVKNAARLFSSVGYDLTAIEMVAERSDVSPATIYNNFDDKIGLLLAVLIDESEDIQQISKRLIANRRANDISVIYRLIELYVDHPMEFMNKSCWRQALAASTASSNKKFTQEYQNVDNQLKNLLIDVMHLLHQEQVFRTEADVQSLGELIWNNVNQMFTDFISDEVMPLVELKNAMKRQTEAIIVLAEEQA
ncbi:TetR/AcrR family transcriptional regulator [Porticoccaceae bacterium]|jgi:AcrR family transcriptional regulator|nr:TetR/AcrR family transcriptional regulator [Porticoccaceae bacterium]MDA8598749.1 TetR/AcrR family transcriptional regulator [Porticoccaceae bacterium]MDA8877982.1 TetR/AcrR family transcriptional regulator [Porticoccaceae bacterium]MDA9582848.1 TetR/AcrR family transcriptional regulator [Porticoccaceae bacterium]MDB2395370.1 TetR/AcrR family transcriptional regulator [Porticoccaceae bacterium]|tara:strand:+ start:1276 stop:1893 length:618 start_codon:yes stop_codon:yes gene_type:complete